MTRDSTCPDLISVTELADNIENYLLLDCRFSLAAYAQGQADFDGGHLPGAHHMDMENDLAGEKTGRNGRHPLPRLEDFQQRLRELGATSASHIVCYDANRLAGAARAWWLLRYFGHKKVSILNGGINAWQAAGLSLETGDAPGASPGDITLTSENTDWVCDIGEMRQLVAEADTLIVDAREEERFRGLAESIDPVAGRLPGARNLLWLNVTDDHGMTRAPEVQRERWTSLSDERQPVLYCGSGITASVNALSLKLAGLGMGRLYAGSFSEWCADPDNPIERDDT